MEAKDTVMSDTTKRQFIYIKDKVDDNLRGFCEEDALLRQAELSFKAGEESRQDEVDLLQSMFNSKGVAIVDLKSVLKLKEEQLKTEKQEGRREVVEELRLRGDMSMNFPFGNIRKEAWQAQLKEWGIEESQESSTSPKE